MSKPRTALIVDDDDDLLQLVKHHVVKRGFQTHTMSDTASAKVWLKTREPAFVLLDIMMPDGNGLDLCRWIRAQERLQRVPILVASGLRDEETIQDALELGAVDFLQKPFDLKTLDEKLARIVGA